MWLLRWSILFPPNKEALPQMSLQVPTPTPALSASASRPPLSMLPCLVVARGGQRPGHEGNTCMLLKYLLVLELLLKELIWEAETLPRKQHKHKHITSCLSTVSFIPVIVVVKGEKNQLRVTKSWRPRGRTVSDGTSSHEVLFAEGCRLVIYSLQNNHIPKT